MPQFRITPELIEAFRRKDEKKRQRKTRKRKARENNATLAYSIIKQRKNNGTN